MQDSAPVGTTGDVEPVDVVEALKRVLDGRQMSRSPRGRGFLAYVVTETLAGRGGALSERTIARRALQRGSGFDGRDDASVRVQATRVRKYLDDYYATEGVDDPIRIRLPRGSYIAAFERADQASADAPTVPGVVVAVLSASGDEPAGVVARALSEALVQHLSAHSHIRVVGLIEPPEDAGRSATAAGVSALLTGLVTVRAGRLRLAVRLVAADDASVLWTGDQSVGLADLAGFEVEEQWSREIAAKLGDPSGPVIRRELGRERSPRTEPELAARLAFYAYLHDGSVDSIADAVRLLDAALDSGCRTAPILAMRAAVANTSSVYDFADRDVELDRAEALAREALARDASNVHAHLVLSWPLLQRGQVEVAVQLAETAARLAPYQPFYLSTSGMVLIACGEWHRGAALIREAQRLQPGMSGQTYSWLAMASLVDGNYGQALAEASLLPADGGYVWGPLYRALALSGLGYREQAEVETARAREMRPDVVDDLAAHLRPLWRLTDEQLARLVALLPEPPAVPAPRGTDVAPAASDLRA